MNDTISPTPGSRESLERRVLLRASGELSSAEYDALNAALAHADEAAAFARFVEEELPLAAKAPRDFVAAAMDGVERAPRDFAAAAIAATSESSPGNVFAMPQLWKWSAAAAAVAMFAFIIARQWPAVDGTAPSPVVAAAEPRTTERLRARLSALDEEISAARTTLARGRYQRSTTL